MRILIVLLCLPFFSTANVYYLKASGGSGSGVNDVNAWNLAKANATTLSPGDSLLIKRGDVFYGQLSVSGGASGNKVFYGTYGTGAQPIFSGLVTLTGWTNIGTNLWESAASTASGSRVNILLISGVPTAQGRWPNIDSANRGFRTYSSHSGLTQITDGSTVVTNWTGAELVVRKERWTFDKGTISAKSGNSFTYANQTDYSPKDGYGYFIQNDSQTVDQPGEWYYNPTTKKVRIFSTTSPSNVQVSTFDNIVSISSKSYIQFDNITFEGSNTDIFDITGSSDIQITNCTLRFAGNNAIFGYSMPNILVQGNTIIDINNNGFSPYYDCANPTVSGNTFKRIGLVLGMATGLHYTSCTAISLTGEGGGSPNAIVERNVIDSVGYIGIAGGQKGGLIRYNVVSNFCMVKDDGGGIYPSSGTRATDSTLRIIKNIVFDGRTASQGTPLPNNFFTWGLYLDDNVHHVLLDSNTVFNQPVAGIFLHNADTITITNNTLYNNKQQLSFQHDIYTPITGVVAKHNIIAADSGQLAIRYYVNSGEVNGIGIVDSNLFSIPTNLAQPIYTRSSTDAGTSRSFTNYKSVSGLDQHSSSNKNIPVYFVYNPTGQSSSVFLPHPYRDLFGNTYTTGEVALPSYSSTLFGPDIPTGIGLVFYGRTAVVR